MLVIRRPTYPQFFLLAAVLTALFSFGVWPEDAEADAEPPLAQEYLERYLRTFPTAATAAGDHRFDARLERLPPAEIEAWLAFNREVAEKSAHRLADTPTGSAEQLDAQSLDTEVLLRQARREVFELETVHRHETDPLYWTSTLSQAALFLLVREDRPLTERLEALAARVAAVPMLVADARASLGRGDPAQTARERCERAAGQARSLAGFYHDGLREPADRLPPGERTEEIRAELLAASSEASRALEELAGFLDALAAKASGSFRLGEHYPEIFRLTTGVEEDLGAVLVRAEAALVDKRVEAAAHCRKLWPRELPGETPPTDDRALVRRCFERLGRDGAKNVDTFVADYRQLVNRAQRFVEEKGLMTLPPRLEVRVDRSPSYFGGAAVGGIYPPGPFAPEGASLLFVPTPPDDATPEQLAPFFRDFNHPFNVMITPHETVPGHAAQMTLAAHGPSALRALFADGVYVEGWGSFSERLMLDAGWGDDLARAAHLKKQLENIARTIVDIRIHTREMSRDEALAFVRDEALQDEQFALNMWNRSLTTAPQITTYWLGYQQIWDLYQEVRKVRGEAFEVRGFVDGMMLLGPVPVRHYRNLFFPPEKKDGE